MKKLFLLPALAFLLASCATVNLTVNKNPAYHEKITKVFIVFKDVKRAEYIRHLSDDLPTALEKIGVQQEHFVYDPLALEPENDLQKKIATFAPKIVLTIERAYDNIGYSKSGAYYDGGYYIASLVPYGEVKPVWKAAIDVVDENNVYHPSENEYYEGKPEFRSVTLTVQKLIERLKLDGLL